MVRKRTGRQVSNPTLCILNSHGFGPWALESLEPASRGQFIGFAGLASIFYFIPKLLGRPLHSYYLAALAFW